MRPGPAAIALGVLLSMALLLPGCGDEGTATAGGGTAIAKLRTAASDPAEPRVSLAARRCRRSLGELLDSLESLANTLAVGLSYEDYLDSVNRVRTTYARIPAESPAIACLGRVAGPAEGALNLYIDAVNAWGDCLATPSCDLGSVEPKLQRQWEEAGDLISSAQNGLRDLG
jgi:hypothetical protein